MVLEGQPEPPAYFARMKRENRDGPPLLGDLEPAVRLTAAEAASRHETGAVFVDVRPAPEFARGHIPASISVPLTRSFTTYAGSVVPYDVPIVFVTPSEDEGAASDAARELALIGHAPIAEYVGPTTLAALGNLESFTVPTTSEAIALHAKGMPIVDVRNAAERAEARIPDSAHIAFPEFVSRAAEFPRERPFLVHCQTGARSAIAVSVLRRLGYDALDAGGLVQWSRAGAAVRE
jgi:hydroxyacylglutathione hydrolase